MDDEIELVVARRHWDPHQVLGAHAVDDGVVVRAFRPDAREIRARVDGTEPVTLGQRHPAGMFEGFVHGGTLPLRVYELEVSYPDGNVYTLRDPYAFAPTLGDLDLHLVGEGRHEELYKRLGAHVREIDGALGTSFAVWAPAARAVSVVGDFNSWDGRLHAMRVLGTSGIWEIFIPGVVEGAAYKFEILTEGGDIRMKADPLAFQTVLMPRTDSIVHRSHHVWRDAAWMEQRRATQPHERPMSIYEVHLGSWRLNPEEGNRSLRYHELADELAAYVTDLGFTHVELMPGDRQVVSERRGLPAQDVGPAVDKPLVFEEPGRPARSAREISGLDRPVPVGDRMIAGRRHSCRTPRPRSSVGASNESASPARK